MMYCVFRLFFGSGSCIVGHAVLSLLIVLLVFPGVIVILFFLQGTCMYWYIPLSE